MFYIFLHALGHKIFVAEVFLFGSEKGRSEALHGKSGPHDNSALGELLFRAARRYNCTDRTIFDAESDDGGQIYRVDQNQSIAQMLPRSIETWTRS